MTDANVTMVDRETGVVVINQTDIETRTVYDALAGPHPEVAALIRWVVTTSGGDSQARQGGIFQRDRYVAPELVFQQFRVAQDAAANDDVISAFLDSTESLAFGRMTFQVEDEDEEDVWNQIGFDLDIESRIREMWRELAVVSQFYAAVWYGQKDYRVGGKNSQTGVKRRKVFNQLTVPLGITLLDPQKVVPVGSLMFNQEQLAYIADRTEIDMLDAAVLNDPQADAVSRQIIVAKYAPPDYERRNLAKQGINAEWLYILNPRNVFRHTVTRSQYRRFAEVRLMSVMELLDLKHQLRQMDRAMLIGGTNFIVLIRKGTDNLPARPEEITNLQAQVSTVARVPILVGDHRLSVEIITPKNDYTLNPDKYATIDSRLNARLYQMFQVHGGTGAVRSDDSIKLAKIIARGMESRRFMMKRTLERRIFGPTVVANDQLEYEPTLKFHPTRIELDFDTALVTLLMDLRDRGDLSRQSVLAELDYDQQDEATWRQREARDFDHIFTMTNSPWAAPGKWTTNIPAGPDGKPHEVPGTKPSDAVAPPGGAAPVAPHSHGPDGTPVPMPAPAKPSSRMQQRSAGRSLGGNRGGGGAAPGTGQGQAPRGARPKNT